MTDELVVKPDDIIVFEKWTDPWDLDNIDLNLIKGQKYNEQLSQDDAYHDDEDEDDEFTIRQMNMQSIPVILTPLGPIPLTEHASLNKNWNFWTGHTKFPITNNIAMIISGIDGVESLDVYTKYRFRFSVGKIFSASEVMGNIHKYCKAYFKLIQTHSREGISDIYVNCDKANVIIRKVLKGFDHGTF